MTTREEAYKFCIERMDDLYTEERKDKRKGEGNDLKVHFGKIDIKDLLDLIYGEYKK